jgi:hypothetical protein
MKKKVSLVLVVFLIIFGGFFSLKVFAKQKIESKIDSVTENSITISWKSIGDHYDIYTLDGKKVWSGKDLKHEIKNLKSNDLVDLKLIAYDENNEIIDRVRFKTSTSESQKDKLAIENSKKNESKIYYSVDNARLETYIKDDEVKLVWSNLPDDDQKYEIYRDGKYITTVDESYYIDNNVEKDKWYRYEIKAYKTIPQDQIEKIKKSLPKAKKKNLSKEDQRVFQEPKTLSAVIKTTTTNAPTKKQKGIVSPLSLPSGSGYMIRYETFIPMKSAPNPWCDVPYIGCTSHHFNGNNRSFRQWNFQAESYKTLSKVYITEENGRKSTKLGVRSVGHTIGYDKRGKTVKVARASSKGITIKYVQNSSTGWKHDGYHSVGNPLATAPNIDAHYYADVKENGSGYFKINHDQAPNHEMYLYTYPGDSVRVIMQDKIHSVMKFFALTPGTPQAYHEVYVDPYF